MTHLPGIGDSFRQVVEGLSHGDIAKRTIGYVEISLASMGANMDHLSLGQFIMSRVRDEVYAQNPDQQKPEDSRAVGLLKRFACWHQVLKKMDMFQEVHIDPRNRGLAKATGGVSRDMRKASRVLFQELSDRVVFCTANTATRNMLLRF
jgi:hypothetical protein